MNNKKNLLIIACFIIVFVINLSYIKASTTSCEYSDLGLNVEYDEAGTSTITQMEYKEANHNWPIVGFLYTKQAGGLEYVNELKHIETELYGSCPKSIYACTYEKMIVMDLGVNALIDAYIPEGTFLEKLSGEEDSSLLGYTDIKKVFLFYSENNMKDNSLLADLPNRQLVRGSEFIDNFSDSYDAGKETCGGDTVWGNICGWAWGGVGGLGASVGDLIGIDPVNGGGIDMYYREYKNCNYVNYTGDLPTYNLACPNLNIYLDRFNEALNEYKACCTDAGGVLESGTCKGSNLDAAKYSACISKAATNVNEKETLIKNYCKSILKEQDFDGGTEQQCIEACLNNVEETVKAKKAAGLLSDNNNDCGFSQRLGTWIVNIFKWIKYILPVLVIILGILDFIKAIGSDKEDEMKKAQKSFIIRLIAAALVFIVPLVLEFVLIKMGFGYDSCGLF